MISINFLSMRCICCISLTYQGNVRINNLIKVFSKFEIDGIFDHVRQRPDRAKIKTEWILETISNPVYTEMQVDGRITQVATYIANALVGGVSNPDLKKKA
ncbi:hypothetical protein J4G08_12015 [Candidatus Poribacteria bacterium]|nr:hypothetical protein [Candidatus Poribacteria bacterium]